MIPVSGPVSAARFGLLKPEEIRAIAAAVACVLIAYAVPVPGMKYAVGAAVGAIFVWASARSFALALAMFMLALPFFDVVYDGSFLVSGLNLQTLALIYFAVLAAAIPSPSTRVGNPLLVPALALMLITSASALLSSASAGEPLVAQLSRVKNWFSYIVLSLIVFRKVHARSDKLIVVVAALVGVMLNVAQSLRQSSNVLSLNLDFMHHRAVSFIALQPNLYGGFLALNLFVFLGLLIYYPMRGRNRAILGLCSSLVALNLIYTMSRGAWLAFLGASLFVVGTKARKLALPLAAVGLVVYFASPKAAVERWDSAFSGEYDPKLLLKENTDAGEAASRIIQWRTFWPLMSEAPIFGAGMGRYEQIVYERGHLPTPKSAHATIIEIGVEQGVVGLLFYFGLLLAVYRSASRVAKHTDDALERSLAIALVGATVCLALLDLSGTRFRNANITAYYWFLASITLNVGTSRSLGSQRSSTSASSTTTAVDTVGPAPNRLAVAPTKPLSTGLVGDRRPAAPTGARRC